MMLRDEENRASPTTAGPWENMADVPLLADTEETVIDREEKEVVETSKEESKKIFSTAEYKVALSHFLRIFSYATRNDILLLLVASFTSICVGVTLPIMNLVFGELVGAFGRFYNPQSDETKEIFVQIIDRNVLYLVFLFAGRLVLDYASIFGFRIVSIRISAAMRLAYLNSLFCQPISVLDTLPSGQTAAILTITTNILQIGISEKLSMLLQSITLVLTALIIAFQYSWALTLVTSSGLAFIVISYGLTIPPSIRMMKEVEHADRMSASIANEAFGAIRMVAACEAEKELAKRHAAWVNESRRRGLLMSPIVAIQHAPVFFAIHATFALAFWYAVKLYLEFEISSVTTIIVVLMSIMTIVLSIGGLAAPITAATQATGAASILFTIIDAPQPKVSGIRGPEISSQSDILFENVNFAYPVRHDVKVLDNLTLRFPAGKVTAIVGPSGSGKSTIVALLERWYELDGNLTDNAITLFFRSGTITTDGRNLYDIDLRWWRSQIGLVQQEPFLFNDTIFRNVEYGLIGTAWEHETRERKMDLVRQACKEAYADEFISRLPEGYNTMVGDAASKLSGGQRQRLAIARSIVSKPNILILDEATSAIDVRSERVVQAALDRASKNRTTIVIAHRLSTIMKADKIVVLKKGQNVQEGTHEELLADHSGPYWSLVNSQHLSMSDQTTKSTGLSDSEKREYDLPERKSSEYLDSSEDLRQITFLSNGFLTNFVSFLMEQKPQWKWYTLMIIAALGAGAAFPLHSYLFAKLISLFSLWGEELRDQTSFWCLMFTLLALTGGICHFALGWSSNTISFNITADYRMEYFKNTITKPVSYYDEEDNSVGSLTSRMATDPTQLQQLLGTNMAIVLMSFFNIFGSISLSFYFGWKLTLVAVGISMPIILAAGFFRLRYETQFERMNHKVFAESSKFASESIGAFRTVSSLTLEPEILGRYETLLRNHTEKAYHKAKYSTFVFAMSDSISLLCMALVLWYGGQLLASHEYSPFNYLVIYLAVVQGSTSAGQSLSFGPNIATALAAAKRIRGMRPRPVLESDQSLLPLDLDEEHSEKVSRGVKIELRDIWFKYPTRDVMVLKGLNMTIKEGQFAAIVGPSGCGKTSIISLLERFYKAESGQIRYQSINIESIPMSTYRKSISLVAQEPSLFEGSIRDNILLGVDESTVSDETLQQACRDAEIHDFVISLPEGYATAVGAKGVALSGGQRQRIAIARSRIRNPRLLLLDEATSNLDSETEKSVQAVLERTGKGRTMIVVAHRLATVQNADVIFVMSEGQVVETGTHANLLRKKGVYFQMCQSQTLGQ